VQVRDTKVKTTGNAPILCAVDFDVNSLAALDLARDLVRENGGTLYVLHVVSSVAALTAFAPLLLEGTRHFARIRLDEIARETLSEIDYRLLLRAGQPAEQIITTAAELSAKMVVLATRGRNSAPQGPLGSVAERVIRGAPCPVLTVGGVPDHESARSHTAGRSALS
jgi:nucleotide-binding universal stress UspA family protein